MTSYEPQPAYPYPYPQAVGAQTKTDTTGWAIAAFSAAAFFALCIVTSVAASFPLVRALDSGETWDTASMPLVLLQFGGAVLAFAAAIGTYVVTSVWLMKARGNALLISPGLSQNHVAWLWLGWWVPFANYFMPFKVVRNVVDGSEHDHQGSAGALLGWWWASWLVMIMAWRIHGSLLDRLGSGDGGSGGAVMVFGVLAIATTVAGLVLWGLLVRRVVDGQSRAVLPA